jgi:hypothetical protein
LARGLLLAGAMFETTNNSRSWVLSAALLAAVFVVISGSLVLAPRDGLSLRVLSDPSGAEVFVDGARIGTTPVMVTIHPHLWGHIRVSRRGYRSWEWRGIYPASGWLPLEAQLLRQEPL